MYSSAYQNQYLGQVNQFAQNTQTEKAGQFNQQGLNFPYPLNQFDRANNVNANPLPIFNVNGLDPTTGFSNNGFKNPKTLLNNNLDPNNILIENVKEYSIFIDSKDRNHEVFPNPFQYTVTLAPTGNTTEIIKGVRYSNETPAPTINDNILNVKYVRLEQIMLPYFYKTSEGKLNKNFSLLDNLYFILNIKELSGENKYATSNTTSKSFAVVYHDHNYNHTHFVGVSKSIGYSFPPDNLGTLNKLSISITDPFGNIYNPDHLDKKIKTCMGCICDEEINDECYFHSLRHPLNPQFQNHIHLKVGIVEPKMNKLIFS